MSPDLWVRGLKLFSFRCCIVCGWSHPTWVRGLKLKKIYQDEQAGRVAPYVGAWIETLCGLPPPVRCAVAPYVGAWIETILIIYQGRS